MSNYINIQNIMAFPVSGDVLPKEGGTRHDFRVLSETNLTNIISSLTDKPSFIVSCEDVLTDRGVRTGYDITFIIKGHYFRVTLTDEYINTNFKDAESIYASILMGNAPNNVEEGDMVEADEYSYMVVGIDYNDCFTGLQFTSKTELCTDSVLESDGKIIVPTNYYFTDDSYITTYYVKPYSLLLFVKEGGSWVSPKESWVKFNPDSLGDVVGDVDGGVVE
jgi:hypothetical protein